MINQFRIQKYDKGYVVEELITARFLCVFKVKFWRHCISPRGMVFENEPWYFPNFELALENLLREVKWHTINNTEHGSK